jgi:ceramide glucosyltransferase
MDPNTYEAFVSQAKQDYPQFEILFGLSDPADPAIPYVHRLQAQFPERKIQLVVEPSDAPNAKVGTLMSLARHARYPVWVVNDSDIKVDHEYLSRVVAPLASPSTGVVTCLYRVKPHNVPARWEALGIMMDFMPSTLVAQLLGVREFGFGSTLAFRAADLDAVGGFAGFRDFVADDFQLAKRIASLSKRVLLSEYVVETSLGQATWRGIWNHQLRWAKTIRASKGLGFVGVPITHAGLWALFALCLGSPLVAGALIGARMLTALITSGAILRSSLVTLFWLAPVWDLYASCVWFASYFGRQVRWRDRTLIIDREGRIRAPR